MELAHFRTETHADIFPERRGQWCNLKNHNQNRQPELQLWLTEKRTSFALPVLSMKDVDSEQMSFLGPPTDRVRKFLYFKNTGTDRVRAFS